MTTTTMMLLLVVIKAKMVMHVQLIRASLQYFADKEMKIYGLKKSVVFS
jgi:hypothetical protein